MKHIPFSKRQVRTILILLVGLILGYFGFSQKDIQTITQPLQPPLAPGYYQVTDVSDGDTFSVNMNGTTETIRLIGVDTPETHHPNKAVQCYGEAASEFLGNLLANTSVRLEADPTNSNRDRYDRLLRYAYQEDGTLINAKIIAEGFGFAYIAFPFEKKDEFTQLQAAARKQNKGLWSSCEVSQDGVYKSTNDDTDRASE